MLGMGENQSIAYRLGSGGSADSPSLGVPEDPVEDCSKVEKKDARTNALSDSSEWIRVSQG
jgi:hypothetical protein